MNSVRKSILCGTAMSAIAFAAPAHAQITIGGQNVEVTNPAGDTANNGGDLNN